MEEARQKTEDFITLTGTHGGPVVARLDRLAAIWGAEGDRHSTQITIAREKEDLKFTVTEKPEDIPGPFATFTGTGGALVRVRPDFVAAVLGNTGDNKTTAKIYMHTAQDQVWNVRESAEEVAAALQRMRAQM
jgi:hypothetical protein